MNKFKGFITESHTKNKEYLHRLYTDKQVYVSSLSSSEQPVEDEKLFYYRNISFQFSGTGFRTPEQTILYVWVPWTALVREEETFTEIAKECSKSQQNELQSSIGGALGKQDMTAYEDWLLRFLSNSVNELSDTLQNDKKDVREKPRFSMQVTNATMQRRNGCLYVAERNEFRLRISFRIPLINGHSINGKSTYKGMKLLLDCICDRLEQIQEDALKEHIALYFRQQEIRAYLKKNNLLAFVADGSILPRQGDSDEPLREAIPFQTPPEYRVEIPLACGVVITGMGLKKGITIITGGGYSGKSTLLDSLEQGIYNHVKGDGREYCLLEQSACKIYAEDGRYVSAADISPFFTYLPGKGNVHAFSTERASGSVSQATNIIEAVYGGCKCLLIDEDTSATNFMIRDETMRQLVKKEPIIPYTDRILELKAMGISTILVIGGSGEYLKYGDCVLLLEDYCVFDKTKEAGVLAGTVTKPEEEGGQMQTVSEKPGESQISENLSENGIWKKTSEIENLTNHIWMSEKYMENPARGKEFFYSQCVQIEHARYIKIDDFSADITKLTALRGEEQIASLTYLLEKLLMEEGRDRVDLRERCEMLEGRLFTDSFGVTLASTAHKYELWLEQIRSIDLLMAVCRLRKK